ncbi:MAG: hypothetical protein JWM77_761 [Rhodospirillales bacterium]|nr:hypothetical protein [Rhodospirillales bacterium]
MTDGKQDQDGEAKAERRDLVVRRPAADRPALEAAAHAYETTEHVADPPVPHRVDLRIDEPPAARRRFPPRFSRRAAADDGDDQRENLHRLVDPTRTAFSVGFGAAAGAAALRVIIGIIGAVILLALAWAALSFLLP